MRSFKPTGSLLLFGEATNPMVVAGGTGGGGYMPENRMGELVFQALPTLSVGDVRVHPGECDSHREVAAAVSVAKKEAKKADKNLPGKPPGGCVFVERRRSGQVDDSRLAGRVLKPCLESAAGQPKEACRRPASTSRKVSAEE